jgi:hypothetical protein
MPTTYPPPVDSALEAAFAGIVPGRTQVGRGPAGDVDADAPGLFAEYATADGDLAALVFADPNTVNYLGGTTAGLDAGAISDASSRSEVLDDSEAAFGAIAAAIASCMSTEYTNSVSNKAIVRTAAELTDAARQLWAAPAGKRVYRVTVDELGAGALHLFLS